MKPTASMSVAPASNPGVNLTRYRRHLEATSAWLERSVRPDGGSSAYFAPLVGWSRPYPETTGYLIPSFINLANFLGEPKYKTHAKNLGEWLLGIQLDCGAWQGGLYRRGHIGKPSVFNTGQILKGLLALYQETHEQRWLDAASKGARWLATGIGKDGYWQFNDYQSEKTPSYYTHVAWPMLAVATETGAEDVRAAAIAFLQTVLARQHSAGDFEGWSFASGKSAFTHTIAYTIRGLQEASFLLDDTEGKRLQEACLLPLEKLRRHAEIYNGHLPGTYREGWKQDCSFTCLTGNAQIAICLLIWEEQTQDIRILNAATKLVDDVCRSQSLTSWLGHRGGVGGSRPLWQRYMRMRYPNWAAKYHCDALMRLMSRLQELELHEERSR